MNAPHRFVPKSDEVTGQFLHANYLYTEGLYLDLYGRLDEDGYCVESIAVAGTKVDISALFQGRQLLNMSYWLDLKDGGAAQRECAEQHRREATRPN